jgi:hypothetical protein
MRVIQSRGTNSFSGSVNQLHVMTFKP